MIQHSKYGRPRSALHGRCFFLLQVIRVLHCQQTPTRKSLMDFTNIVSVDTSNTILTWKEGIKLCWPECQKWAGKILLEATMLQKTHVKTSHWKISEKSCITNCQVCERRQGRVMCVCACLLSGYRVGYLGVWNDENDIFKGYPKM